MGSATLPELPTADGTASSHASAPALSISVPRTVEDAAALFDLSPLNSVASLDSVTAARESEAPPWLRTGGLQQESVSPILSSLPGFPASLGALPDCQLGAPVRDESKWLPAAAADVPSANRCAQRNKKRKASASASASAADVASFSSSSSATSAATAAAARRVIENSR